jgi:hypothetical protein
VGDFQIIHFEEITILPIVKNQSYYRMVVLCVVMTYFSNNSLAYCARLLKTMCIRNIYN